MEAASVVAYEAARRRPRVRRAETRVYTRYSPAPRLTETEADRAERAFEAALADLSASALVEPPEALREVAGVPSASDARALLDALRATLKALRSGVRGARGLAISAPCTA